MWRPQVYLTLVLLLLGVLQFDFGRGHGQGPQIFRDATASWINEPWTLRIQMLCFVMTFYLALRSILRDRRHLLLNFLIIILGMTFITTTLFNVITANRNLHLFLYAPYKWEKQSMQDLSSRAVDDTAEPEDRLNKAKAAYRVFRINLVYKDAGGNLVPFIPADNDRFVRADLEKGSAGYNAGFAEIDGMLDRSARTLATVVAMGFFGLVVVLAIDVAYQTVWGKD